GGNTRFPARSAFWTESDRIRTGRQEGMPRSCRLFRVVSDGFLGGGSARMRPDAPASFVPNAVSPRFSGAFRERAAACTPGDPGRVIRSGILSGIPAYPGDRAFRMRSKSENDM